MDNEKLSVENVSISVETNLKHLGNMEDHWHHIKLPYRGAKDEVQSSWNASK